MSWAIDKDGDGPSVSHSVRFVVGELNPYVKYRANVTAANEDDIFVGNNEFIGEKMGEDAGSMVKEKL